LHDPSAPPNLDAAIQHCCALARRSKTQFYLTFFALPKPLFRDMCVLYAFMRLTDDLADDTSQSPEARAQRLDAWRKQFSQALAGERVEDPVLMATTDLVHRHEIPPQLLSDVIDGVASDLTPRRIVTQADLEDYCYHVAGAVGLCCIRIWKYRDPRAESAAVACGAAFQLTNILRDLKEDALNGRCYLPEEDLARFGVTPERLATGSDDPAYQSLLRFEADRARAYYEQAAPLMEWLSPEGRRVQRAMTRMYGGLLDEIERRRFDVQSERVRIPRRVKWSIAAQCLLRR
jgi:phytoene synthase